MVDLTTWRYNVDDAARRLALLMEEDVIPDVVPPRQLTPEEKLAAVEAYLNTETGRRAIQDAADRRAGTIHQRIRVDELRARQEDNQIQSLHERVNAAERRRREQQEVAAREAAVAEANRQAQQVGRRTTGQPRTPATRDNSEFYRRQRDAVRNVGVVREPRQGSYARGDEIQFESSSEPVDPFGGLLSDL